MGNAISGKEYPLAKIFGKDFEYHIPSYQRPYAWTQTEAMDLFDDLYDFYQKEEQDSYFLGSIVLIKDESKPHADVIDGQQRLTTLSILFSVIADYFTNEAAKRDCKRLLREEESELMETKAQPRLFLRDKDQPFFEKYIQNVDLKELLGKDAATLEDEAQKHIQENCRVLWERFKESFSTDEELRNEELLKFSQFLLTRCFLIVVSTENQESAFRIFSVMNSRGLDLLPTDIIKSETIGKIAPDLQKEYTDKWEKLEIETTRDGFNEVFTHTRTIFAKERPKKNLLEEFRESVLCHTTPQSLIDNYLEPYANAYIQLKNCAYQSTKHAEEINDLLIWLNKTNNYDWMPPAIKFLAEYGNDSAYVLWFMQKLERLASYLLVTARDVNRRTDRYKWILVEMESRPQTNLNNPLKNVELTEWEKKQFRDTLQGEIYSMPSQRRNYIIQRLDSFYSDGGASYNEKLFTIEHVLPQNPNPDSEWAKSWSKEQQVKWLNRLANLVPLTRQRNSAAQNYDFQTKKEKYFQSKKGTSSYKLTTQVLSYQKWTPEIVEKRQEDLLNKLVEKWNLWEDLHGAESPDFMIAGRGGNAVGIPQNDGKFLVKKGSRIAESNTAGLQKTYVELRANLTKEGVIKENIFQKDYLFDSPSSAAMVVLGRSANGRREWTKIDGRSISKAVC